MKRISIIFIALIPLVLSCHSNCSKTPLATNWPGFERGMGIGGWLTNYKRFNVIRDERRMVLTVGDYEHFESFITRDDVANIASMGMWTRPQNNKVVIKVTELEENDSHWVADHRAGCVFPSQQLCSHQ